ncbi:uncharacterized protein LOC134710945 [Mytilus trossulus]|uniref:uncharacterized protein LOC134710945 n=1 Tax=Mytilus trossulus TaxID=6551 RepID=UPI00300454D0
MVDYIKRARNDRLCILYYNVFPYITKTNGKSKKGWIILKSNDTPETYHVVEGDDFTIECEMKNRFLKKCVQWQINECYIQTEIDKYILNDSKLSLTIKNLSKDDTGTYKCIVSNWFGLNNTSIDRCTNYLSALHRWMTWVHMLHEFKACRKEDENGITVTVHELPKEYKHELKKKGEKVLMRPKIDNGKETMKSLQDNIKYVVWFYKTADILRVGKPDQHGDINFGDINDEVVKQVPHGDIDNEVVKQGPLGDIKDEVVKQGPHGDINDGVVKQGPHGDINDGVVKQGPHGDINDGVVIQGPHGDINDGVVKQGPHGDINDGVVKQGPHGDINDGVVKQGLHGDINDGVVKQGPHGDINDGVVIQGPHGDINDGVVKQGPHGDINDGVVKQGPHGDINDGVVKQGLHGDINDGVVKQGPHGDINDGVVKQGPHGDINDGVVKQGPHGDINDGANKPDQHHNLTDEGIQDKHALVFNAAVSHHGQYVGFIVTTNGNISSNGWKLKVVLQGSVYQKVTKHRKDSSYVKTAPEENAMKSLENNGFVVIVGRKGTGKSKICLQLASLFEENDYLPYEVDQKSLDSTQTADLKSTKVMFIIDHSVYNQNDLGQILDQLTEVSGITRTKMIFTCRHLEPFTRKILQRYKLYNNKALIELDKILTVDDKRKILGVHMEVNNIVQSKDTEIFHKSKSAILGEDVITDIIKIEPFWGFPLTASKFCSQRENLKKGEKYFTNPPKFLVDEICDLYQSVLKNKEPELFKEYFILVYLATDDRLCFDVSVTDMGRIRQVNQLINGGKTHINYEMSAFKDVADKLVAKFKYIIKCDDHTYRFIHPSVLKAVFLSSEHLLNHFIENGDVEDIIEFVRSFLYEATDDDIVLKLKEDRYNILCERLIFMMTEKEKKIGHYIYDCFIKLQDTSFLNVLTPKLQCVASIRQMQNDSSANNKDSRQSFENVNQAAISNNYEIEKQKRSEEAPASKLFSPTQMIAMIEYLTRTGEDSWIYEEKQASVPDFMVLYGLIVGCKNNFLGVAENKKTFEITEKEKTFNIILKMFTHKLKDKSFRLLCCTPMDTFNNKFCHFLTLFNDLESSLILKELIEGLKMPATKDTIPRSLKKKTELKNILKSKNNFKQSPLQMAAFLGKAEVFTHFSSESKKKKGKKEKLYDVVQNGMGEASVTSRFTNLNFDPDLGKSICVGDTKAYQDIFAALNKW